MITEAAPAKRAPEPLRVVQQFVNSADLETGEDDLATPRQLQAWLADRDLLPAGARVTAAELARARDVREGLRALLLAHNGAELDRAALQRLERASRRATLRTAFGSGGQPPRLDANGTGVDGALARLLAVVATAGADGTWQRLKACADHGCAWAFYDNSKNRSGRWCSMEVCGNRQKARAYRGRRGSAGAASS